MPRVVSARQARCDVALPWQLVRRQTVTAAGPRLLIWIITATVRGAKKQPTRGRRLSSSFTGGDMDRSPVSRRRRDLIKSAGAVTALGPVGFPAIVRSQADAIRIGHLTPRTGFLGPLGEYAVIGVNLAVDEINAAGGVMGRKIELIAEDSVNPQTASTKAERLIERDKVVAIIGEIRAASGVGVG